MNANKTTDSQLGFAESYDNWCRSSETIPVPMMTETFYTFNEPLVVKRWYLLSIFTYDEVKFRESLTDLRSVSLAPTEFVPSSSRKLPTAIVESITDLWAVDVKFRARVICVTSSRVKFCSSQINESEKVLGRKSSLFLCRKPG